MPLPDADPDKRMYKLLKNIDLENLSFAQFQSTAQTVFAEPESEDTLRRIVLINLSRMAVAGDWNGLTTAAGGGYPVKSPTAYAGSSDFSNLTNTVPFSVGMGSNFNTINPSRYVAAIPFIAPVSGTASQIGTYVQTGSGVTDNLILAVYENAALNVPGTLLGYGEIDMTSSGSISDASITGTISVTAGTMYWLCYGRSTLTTSAARCRYVSANDRSGFGWGPAPNQTTCLLSYGGTDWTTDSIVDGVGTVTSMEQSAVCSIGVKYA